MCKNKREINTQIIKWYDDLEDILFTMFDCWNDWYGKIENGENTAI